MKESFPRNQSQGKLYLLDLFGGFIVVTIWGANFTFMKMGLLELDPFVLGAFRYSLTAFPAVFFVKRPEIESRYLIAYGLFVGLGQFGCLFYALKIGLPASIASVLLQTQAFMTCILAFFFLKEKISRIQITGLAIAIMGLLFIVSAKTPLGDPEISRTAVVLTLCAAFSWAMSNIVVKLAVSQASEKNVCLNMFGFIVWSSMVPPVPFFLLAFFTAPFTIVVDSIINISRLSLAVIFYNAFLATLFGFCFWSKLLSRYPAAQVAPFSLLIPVTALATARMILNELPSTAQWLGCAAIFCGLAVNVFFQSREGQTTQR